MPRMFKTSPVPPGFAKGQKVPSAQASYFSRLLYLWVAPFLRAGFSRPLEQDDLWELEDSRLAATSADRLETGFYSRCEPKNRPHALRDHYSQHDAKDAEEVGSKTPSPKGNTPKYDASLPLAIFSTFFSEIAIAGFLNLIAETLRTTTPLVTKVLLTWLTESYIYFRLSDSERQILGLAAPRGVGYGVGLAIGLFAMQETASLLTNHYTSKSMTTGMSIKASLVGNIFRKSLRLSGRARKEHSVGNITTMISTDTSKLELMATYGHMMWIAPIQLAIGLGLLISTLGVSSLVGLGVVIFGMPIQGILVAITFNQHKKGLKFTDSRVRLTSEVLHGIRLIKAYGWENFYLAQIGKLREKEARTFRTSAIAVAGLLATMTVVPILATILSFITYALTGHDLNVVVVFTALQYFNIIRIPLVSLPVVLALFADTLIALGRISKFLTAEELADPFLIEPERKYAVEVDGSFQWETTTSKNEGGPKSELDKKSETGKAKAIKSGKGKAKGVDKKRTGGGKADVKNADGVEPKAKGGWFSKKKATDKQALPLVADLGVADEAEEVKEEVEEEKPFELHDLKLKINKGDFVAIVGRVGTGKSSALQALTGEMRKIAGEVHLGGTISYVPQTPWIRNASLRENVLFGQNDDENKFREVIRACSLDHDLEMLPQAEETEIGEKGINLSGGQKARVSLARAAYSSTDIVLMDDPLSAVDSYVGKAILENCILSGPLASRTRVLVTHSLHVLDRTDYIYVLDKGTIVEHGTYSSLMQDGAVFSKLIEEYGNAEDSNLDGKKESPTRRNDGVEAIDKGEEPQQKQPTADLMQVEERNFGFVTWDTYRRYFAYAGGLIWGVIILALLTLSQAAQVFETLFLGFWTSNEIRGFSQRQYMAVYASLGVAQALFLFLMGVAFAFASLVASISMYNAAISRVLHSPTSFFDTTPMGRILSRLSKDQATLDGELSSNILNVMFTFSGIFGTVALVFYVFPLLGIIFAPMAILYYLVAVYYRRSSVETKRLDSILRSQQYAAFSETLTGLSTIRAYREQARSVRQAEQGLDLQNRAYFMTIILQRWLGVRLDLCGNLLIFGIALFAAGFRHTVNPAKVGVVLTNTLGITILFSEVVSQFAQTEQNMNAVERVLHYTDLPPEEDGSRQFETPSPSWPERGAMEFKNVAMAYREGLPLVLKDVSFSINPGEKVGVVGRTGAGKSSLLQALFRVVELHTGTITIDGVDIHNLRLEVLRQRLALVPQDSTLFMGTLRENIDPLASLTDAELISALQRAWLLPRDGPTDPVTEAKFSLDAVVGDDGANYSAGEKQLLALCRALVKNSRIIVLDEATSSVDVETDSKVQRTIQAEFSHATLLCIAHRLNTIAYYDRVLVMDEGRVAEFDTVLNLFDKEDSIFRSLCNEANLQRADIVRIRAEHGQAREAPL